jgi:hypothetical protein
MIINPRGLKDDETRTESVLAEIVLIRLSTSELLMKTLYMSAYTMMQNASFNDIFLIG